MGWSGNVHTHLVGAPERAFTGERFLRLEVGADDATDKAIERYIHPPIDLERFNHVGIAVRHREQLRHGPILLHLYNADGQRFQGWIRPGKDWTFHKFDISNFARRRINRIVIYFALTQGFWEKGKTKTFEMDVDTLSFLFELPKPPKPFPERVARYRSPFRYAKPKKREIPPIQEWFPMGFYGGPPDERVWEYVLDGMVRCNMNAWYINNCSPHVLERLLPLVEARGIRLIYQGGGAGSLYYPTYYPDAQLRRKSFEKEIVPAAKQWLPKFVNRFGLAAWSLTEEIHPEVAEELSDYYALVRRLDPSHPRPSCTTI